MIFSAMLCRSACTRHVSALLCAVAFLGWPFSLHAQGKDRFVQALTDFSNAVAGTSGDEGPALLAALDEMSAGLKEWDALVAKVETGFSAAVGAAPPSEAARMRTALGTVYLERGRTGEAIEQFEAAARLDAAFADVHLLQALAYELVNRPRDAAAAYRFLWEKSGDHPVYAYLYLRSTLVYPSTPESVASGVSRANSAETPGPAPAMQALAAAVERARGSVGTLFVTVSVVDDSAPGPVFAPAAYAEGFALLRSNQFDAAVTRFRAAVMSDPLVGDAALQDPAVRDGIAGLRDGKDASSIAAALSALAPRFTSAELHRVLGLAYAKAGHDRENLEHLRRSVQLGSQNERARLALADALVQSGDAAAGRAMLAETAKAIPKSGMAHWTLGTLCQRLGDETCALGAFGAAATIAPLAGAAHLYGAIARLYHNQLDLEAAVAAYRQRAALTPNDSSAHLDLGEIYRAQGTLDAALTEFLVAALLDPASARALAAIGQVHAAAGRDADAEAMLRRAISVDGAHLEARYALSRALMRLGRTEEARQELEAYQQLQAKAMEQERRRFKENQIKIDEALKASEPGRAR